MRRFYTIDDLYTFCKTNHFEKFSATEQGAPLIVQSFGTFEAADNETDGLLSVKLKSCHTGKNRNKSGISDATMELYKNSFKGRPILGAIYKTDTGEYEFRAHDMEIVEDGDGVDINYIEQPIGVVSQTKDPYLEFDEDKKKNYLMVEGTIFSDYSKAAEILERRRTCKCSVEIAVEEMSYNCSEDYLSIDKFHFTGVTILGYQQDGTTEIQEGMAGSKITIDDFSAKHNSVFRADYQEKMIEVLDKLNTTLSNFNKDTTQKGGDVEMNKFEELLEKYGVKAEEVTFEVEGLSDDELEEVFKEAFENGGSDEGEGEPAVEEPKPEEGEGEGGVSEDGEGDPEPAVEEKFTKTFTIELSHEDVRCALYNLIAQYEEEDNEWYGIRSVYDNYFYMQGWFNNKIFKLGYTIDGENVALEGERQEMFEIIVTESEKLAIDKMREDYADLESKYNELKSFKDQYDAAQIKAEKDAVLESVEYAEIKETEEFKALVAEAENLSVDEIKVKADLIFAASMKKKFSFAVKTSEQQHSLTSNLNAKPDMEAQAYAGLFAE